MKMKKILIPFIVALAGIISSCENMYVQEILRGPAILDNLTLYTDDQIRYKLNPDFDSDVLEYTTSVPYPTASIMFEGFDHRDADIKYSLSLDGETYGEENSSGVFEFDKDVYRAGGYVKIRLNREHMDERIYTVHVIRISDAMLWDLRLRSKSAIPSDLGIFNALAPGYDPDKSNYTVKVNSAAVELFLWSVRKNGVEARYRSTPSGGPPGSWFPVNAGDDETNSISFPTADDTITLELEVQMAAGFPDLGVKTYTVAVAHPFTVAFDTDPDTAEFTTPPPNADGVYGRFTTGNVVSFSMKPPFGKKTSGISYTFTSPDGIVNGPFSISPSPSHIYSLIMPGGNVTISGQSTVIPAVPGVRYVWEGGRPYGVGAGKVNAQSWATATNDLQALIDAHGSPSSYEIWIAQGAVSPIWAWVDDTTIPKPGWATAITSNENKTKDNWCFVLKNGVKIYGGFQGIEELQTQRDTRNITQHETILSGTLKDFGNTRHLILAANITGYTLLDGLTVADSMAGGRAYNITIAGVAFGTAGSPPASCWTGAGIYTKDCDQDLVFSRLVIRDNSTMVGGGVFNHDSSPTFRDCVFYNNSAYSYGGAMVNYTASPLIENCELRANPSSDPGGGIYNVLNSHPVLVDTKINGNWGGGIYGLNSSLTVTGGEINSNKGSGVTIAGTGNYTLTNVRISGNDQPGDGGGIYAGGIGSLALTNVEISGNRASGAGRGGGIYISVGAAATAVLTNVSIAGNFADNGGGIYRYNPTVGTLRINNAIVWGNAAATNPGVSPSPLGNALHTNNLIQGLNLGAAPFNGTTDPLFISLQSITPTIAGDYRLQNSSPAVNAGNNGVYDAAGGPATDLAGATRKVGAIDLGAYEVQP
jgi:hypothetical protein